MHCNLSPVTLSPEDSQCDSKPDGHCVCEHTEARVEQEESRSMDGVTLRTDS
jgi:hypothetical protein